MKYGSKSNGIKGHALSKGTPLRLLCIAISYYLLNLQSQRIHENQISRTLQTPTTLIHQLKMAVKTCWYMPELNIIHRNYQAKQVPYFLETYGDKAYK